MTETVQQEQQRQDQESPLYSERGTTNISDRVVSQIIDLAVNEIQGIRLGRITTEVGKYEVAVDFNMEMEFGRDLLALTSALRTRISEQVRHMTGLRLKEQNITVTDIFPDSGDDQQNEEELGEEQQEQEEPRVR